MNPKCIDFKGPSRNLGIWQSLVPICLGLSVPSQGTAETPLAKGFIQTFDDISFRKDWWFADFDHGGERFVTGWRRKMASVELPISGKADLGGALTLRLEPSTGEGEKAFWGAEAQRSGEHLYGDYEVIMQAGRGPGVISAFFTYTGPYFKDPHDEIDVEILGKDTTSMFINLFADGKHLPGRSVPLGFDAADSPNLYRFEWREDSVTWYANGKELLHVTSDEAVIPSTPGKLFVSIWMGAPWQKSWSGFGDPQTRTSATFHCISFRPVGDTRTSCSEYAKGTL